MADRIFPASIHESLGNKKEINQIDADFLTRRLAEVQSGDVATSKASEDVLAMLREIEAATGETESDETATTAKRAIPEAFREHMFKKKDEKTEDEVDGMERDGDEDGKTAKASTVRTRKVLFTSPEQISAAALRTASANGDTQLAGAILAVRDERRERLANTILADSQRIMEREATIAKRQAYRMSIIESTETAKKVVAAAQSTGRVATNAGQVTTASKTTIGYKQVGKLSTAEKSAFAQMAESHGFPAEYVASLLGAKSASISAAEQEIREVMSSALPASTKKSAVSGLVRTAKLSDEQLQRARDYWKNDLGYGDVEWIDDLFTNKFNN